MISDAGIARLLEEMDSDRMARCVGCGREHGSGLEKCGACHGREIREAREGMRAAGRPESERPRTARRPLS